MKTGPRPRLGMKPSIRCLCRVRAFNFVPSISLTYPADQRKILSAGRLHDGPTERKAESQDISGAALKHETAFRYGVGFDGERELSRNARAN